MLFHRVGQSNIGSTRYFMIYLDKVHLLHMSGRFNWTEVAKVKDYFGSWLGS